VRQFAVWFLIAHLVLLLTVAGLAAVMTLDTASVDLKNLVSGFIGAVVGAVIGGAISYMLAKQASKEAAARDAAAKRDRQRAQAYRCLVNAQRLLSDLVWIKRHIDTGIETAEKLGRGSQPLWARVPSAVGVFESVPIDTDDLIWLMEAKELAISNNLIDVSRLHAHASEAMKLYGQLRSEVKRVLPVKGSEGPILISEFDPAERIRLIPYAMEMDTLLESLMTPLPEQVKQARNLCEQLGPAARNYFGDPKFPRLTFPDAESSNS